MPYTIINAIEDEIVLLEDLEKWASRNEKTITENIYAVNRQVLTHLLQRMKGYDFNIATDKTGKEYIKTTKTNRKSLEDEYPALKKAAEQYDIIKNMVDSDPGDSND